MTRYPRGAFLAAVLLAVAACHDPSRHPSSPAGPGGGPSTGTPTSPGGTGTPASPGGSGTPTNPPTTPPVTDGPVVVGTGTGRNPLTGSVTGSSAIAVSVDRGLYVLDPVLAAETSLQGAVYVAVNGATPPPDTTVEVNGVTLVREELPGSPESPFRLDASGEQPEPDSNGMVNITVRTGALEKTMSLPCPPDVALTSSAVPDSNIRGKSAIELSWDGDIEANEENPFPTAFTTSAKLMHYSYATHLVGDAHYSTKYVPAGSHSVKLEVAPSDDGYCAELRWQGKFFQAGNSRGFCGRAKRIEYRY